MISRFFSLVLLLALSGATLRAQVPPAEQLLPEDAIGFISVPDWQTFMKASKESPWGQLWRDPAMRPFRENFQTNLHQQFLLRFEKELGIQLKDYQELLQGQLTVAFPPPAEGRKELSGILLLLDAKDRAEQLKILLADLRTRWSEAGKEVKTETIRNVEFATVAFSGTDLISLLQKAFPGEPEEGSTLPELEKTPLRIGQYKGLFIAGDNPQTIEKILAKLEGGFVTSLAESAAFQKSQSLTRESLAYGWVNVKPIYNRLLQFAAEEPDDAAPGLPAMKVEKVLPALGFAGLESIAARVSASPEGTRFDVFIENPEAQREGLLKLLALEKKDSTPPPFVPADAVTFKRWRLNGQKAWATLEGVLGKIDPSILGLVQLMLATLGKDQDPNFDFRQSLIGNLGDDLIIYEKNPREADLANLENKPFLILVGSPNPSQLVDAVRMITSIMPPPLNSVPLKEREFLGKKIYSLATEMPTAPTEKATELRPGAQRLNFVASGGYAAFSTDEALLEEYLRSAENPPQALQQTAGIMEAIEKVGGRETGMLSFDNQAESTRHTFAVLKNNPEAFQKQVALGFAPAGPDKLKQLLDVKLLPQFDLIAKYFHFAVTTGTSTPEGFHVRVFAPMPPALR